MTGPITACPHCDALTRTRIPGPGERVRCPRCRTVLRRGRNAVVDQVLALAMSVPPLMIVGLTASFLSLSGSGAHSQASVIDAAEAVATSRTWPLALVVGALIIALPVIRALALCYVLLPIRLGRPPARFATAAFRLSIELRPWAMAEVFVVGVAVALVKISGLATVTPGPAFWAFMMLAGVALAEDMVLCRRSIWDLIL